VSHAEIAIALGNAIGRSVHFESISPKEFITMVTGACMPQWQAEDYAHYDRGEAGAVSPDVRRVTGADARSVYDFANDYAYAFQST
jgi:hypothetical protein